MQKKNLIASAVKELNAGNVILCPTDTIWGISCDATNDQAVEKIVNIKERPLNKSFIVLVNSYKMINQIFTKIPDIAWDLFDLAEDPLTLVLENASYISPKVINNDGSLGVRFIKGSITCNTLLNQFGKPIVSTSPNISGKATPSSYDEINNKILSSVDFSFPPDQVESFSQKPSKIIKISENGEIMILRK